MNESPGKTKRKDRLITLIGILRDGARHRGKDLARATGVSERSLYRDMQTLMQSGVPVAGTRGLGYQLYAAVTLPPLNLTMAELEALHLGIAVMTEARDPALMVSARSLADKIEAALPEDRLSPTTGWGLAVHPFADMAAGVRHVPVLRAAIRSRGIVRVTYQDPDGGIFHCVAQPLGLDYWGRVWTCTLSSGPGQAVKTLRLDRIKQLTQSVGGATANSPG